MDLGSKLKAARLEAGLSQRQLCGGIVTRNMLSQIENGTAHPSMDTLRQFAARLHKPISYFLEDEAVTSPNQGVIDAARHAFRARDYGKTAQALAQYRSPDAVFDPEFHLLAALCRMEQARLAIEDRRLPYARTLLEQAQSAGQRSPYFTPALQREWKLLLSETGSLALPHADDRELLLRGQLALEDGDFLRCLQLLDAAECRETPRWQLLRGEAYFAAGQYQNAALSLSAAEEQFPQRTVPKLEVCYRELKNFEKAYEYACKRLENYAERGNEYEH